METTKIKYHGQLIDFVVKVDKDEIEENYKDNEREEDTLVIDVDEINKNIKLGEGNNE